MDYAPGEVRDRKGHGVVQKYERGVDIFRPILVPWVDLIIPPLTRICPTPILAELHFDTLNPLDLLPFSL